MGYMFASSLEDDQCNFEGLGLINVRCVQPARAYEREIKLDIYIHTFHYQIHSNLISVQKSICQRFKDENNYGLVVKTRKDKD